jgi:hypothetical protein
VYRSTAHLQQCRSCHGQGLEQGVDSLGLTRVPSTCNIGCSWLEGGAVCTPLAASTSSVLGTLAYMLPARRSSETFLSAGVCEE